MEVRSHPILSALACGSQKKGQWGEGGPYPHYIIYPTCMNNVLFLLLIKRINLEMLCSMKMKPELVKSGGEISSPHGWEIHHTTCIYPEKGQNFAPYFAVLLTKTQKREMGKERIGFKIRI